jgi:type IV fimbrial biogenesis protein FimT
MYMNATTARGEGFSLVELMVIVAIIAILAGIAAWSLDSLTKGQRARSASFALYSALTTARSEALKRGAPVSVTPGSASDWGSGWTVSYVSAEGDPGTPERIVELARQGPIAGVTIQPSPGPLAALVFARTGRPGSTPGFEVAAGGTSRRCVRLELSGTPRTTSGACA